MFKKDKFKNKIIRGISVYLGISFVSVLPACDKTQRSFSLLSDEQTFQQNGSTFTQRKIDILWVVDNSGSMQTSQANLVSNYNAFITRFQTLGFDYHMAVIGTDAYLADNSFNNSYNNYLPNAGKFKDGNTGSYTYGHSGVYVMTPENTTASIFQKNLSIGTNGNGDERAFSSIVQSLSDPLNAGYGFRRPDAFLAVIILSDEDDFSGTASNYDHSFPRAPNYIGDHNYNVSSPLLRTVDYYVNWLDSYAFGHENYSVSSIFVDSASCASQLSRSIGQRYAEISDKTNGQKGSICSDFGSTLEIITDSVLELASIFQLDRIPQESTIKVKVNNVFVNNDAVNGWTYIASSNSIAFHGTAIPEQGAIISITFDPIAPKN